MVGEWAGLRPCRDPLRLEKQLLIVNNRKLRVSFTVTGLLFLLIDCCALCAAIEICCIMDVAAGILCKTFLL